MSSFGNPSIREIIEIVLHRHSKDCIFVENAAEVAEQEVKNAMRFIDKVTPEVIIDLMEDAIKKTEIYCPHRHVHTE